MEITIQEIQKVLAKVVDGPDRVLSPVTDCEKVTSDTVFFAFPGPYGNGWDYLQRVKGNGGQWAVVPQSVSIENDYGLSLIQCEDPVLLLARLLREYYQYPSHSIAVTGTNGKSSTSYYCAQLSEKVGLKAGIIGTFGLGPLNNLQHSNKTTPDMLLLNGLMHQMKKQGVDLVALEASSHGLTQKRMVGLPLSVAIFTNLTREHLDYHHTMENYAEAKRTLFTYPDLKRCVMNMDDPFSERMMEGVNTPCYRYSLRHVDADFCATNLKYKSRGIEATLKTPAGKYIVDIPLLGEFNIYNALAALAAMWDFSANKVALIMALSALKGAPGRMQCITRSGKPLVVIDYSHTPDALSAALKALKHHTDGKIIALYGCGGDRDRGKRPLMTDVVLQGADIAVLTSDNPRFENPMNIMNEACEKICREELQQRGRWFQEEDRQRAISRAISLAGSRDTVLIAGKGHETYQEVAGVQHYFDDVAEAEKALADYVCPIAID